MRVTPKVCVLSLLALLGVISALDCAAAGTTERPEIDKKLAAIVNYERGMDTQPLIAVEELIRESQNRPEQRKYIERRLAELLDDATAECKSFICRQLWFIGTAESVPAVAKLLRDEETADMACYAIGQNPSPEAGKALRDALRTTPPKVRIRIVNLLGDRRDAQSVEAVGRLVFGAESDVAEAAVAALGKIGGPQARKILTRARAEGDSQLQFAATDAYLRCAEDLAAEGELEQATAIYGELAAEDEAAIVRSAAMKGLADISGPNAVSLVVAALYDENRMVRTTAMGCARTMRGEGVTKRFADELPKISHRGQLLLIDALANRQDRAALPAITTAAGSTNAEVRVAAMYALGSLGDASCVPLLVRTAATDNQKQKNAALFALTKIGGANADDAIVKSMQDSNPSVRAQLIQVLLDRNAVSAVPALLAEAAGPDPKIRRAAFKALGRLAGEKDLPSLVGLLVRLQDDSGRREAERAVIAVSRRITGQNNQADAVLAALGTEEDAPVRCSLLRVLGGVANDKALETLAGALKETDPAVRDAAVRALANWPNAGAEAVLLGIYRDTQNRTHRLLALRGFVRSLALPADDFPVQKRLTMCRRAMSGVRGPEERKLVLSGLANVGDPAALAMVEPFLQTEAVRAEAATAAIKIAGAIVETHPDQARAAMSKLLAVSQDEAAREQAEEIVRRTEEYEKGTPETRR